MKYTPKEAEFTTFAVSSDCAPWQDNTYSYLQWKIYRSAQTLLAQAKHFMYSVIRKCILVALVRHNVCWHHWVLGDLWRQRKGNSRIPARLVPKCREYYISVQAPLRLVYLSCQLLHILLPLAAFPFVLAGSHSQKQQQQIARHTHLRPVF